jgi:hypothetical protein
MDVAVNLAGTSRRLGARCAASDPTLAPDRHVRTAQLLGRLSEGLDVATGHAQGHAVRTAYVAVRLASSLHLSDRSRQDLLYAALLKDLGAPAEASRMAELLGEQVPAGTAADLIGRRSLPGMAQYLLDRTRGLHAAERARHLVRLVVSHRGWSRQLAEARYKRGAQLVQRLGLGNGTSRAVEATGERWDGRGGPDQLHGEQIPLLARIVAVAATTDDLVTRFGPRAAERLLRIKRGRSLDPELTMLAIEMGRLGLWRELTDEARLERLLELEPRRLVRFSEDGLVGWVDRVTRGLGVSSLRTASDR